MRSATRLLGYSASILLAVGALAPRPALARDCSVELDPFSGQSNVQGMAAIVVDPSVNAVLRTIADIAARKTSTGFQLEFPMLRKGVSRVVVPQGAETILALGDGSTLALTLATEMTPVALIGVDSLPQTKWLGVVNLSPEDWSRLVTSGLTGWKVETAEGSLVGMVNKSSTKKVQKLLACVSQPAAK
jgi:hypothetical protein